MADLPEFHLTVLGRCGTCRHWEQQPNWPDPLCRMRSIPQSVVVVIPDGTRPLRLHKASEPFRKTLAFFYGPRVMHAREVFYVAPERSRA